MFITGFFMRPMGLLFAIKKYSESNDNSGCKAYQTSIYKPLTIDMIDHRLVFFDMAFFSTNVRSFVHKKLKNNIIKIFKDIIYFVY